MTETAGGWARDMRFLAQLRALPPRVALFQWRARRLAWQVGDEFAMVSATRPSDVAVLLKAARGCRRVAEIGTGSGWTAISLALADPGRLVATYDPVERPLRESYLRLAGPGARRRVTFVPARGDEGGSELVDLLYIDSSHGKEDTICELEAWRPFLCRGSLVVFDDYGHPAYPGVEEAVRCLRLAGEQRGSLFIHPVSV